MPPLITKSWFHPNSELSPACGPQLLFPQPSGFCRAPPHPPGGAGNLSDGLRALASGERTHVAEGGGALFGLPPPPGRCGTRRVLLFTGVNV